MPLKYLVQGRNQDFQMGGGAKDYVHAAHMIRTYGVQGLVLGAIWALFWNILFQNGIQNT